MVNPLHQKILETLSFFEPMTWERLIIEFDEGFLKSHPDFTKEELEEDLKKLAKKKHIKIGTNEKGEKTYLRQMPPKSWWRRLFG
jgi:hypothetical protein